jgi:hypothetical protein
MDPESRGVSVRRKVSSPTSIPPNRMIAAEDRGRREQAAAHPLRSQGGRGRSSASTSGLSSSDITRRSPRVPRLRAYPLGLLAGTVH